MNAPSMGSLPTGLLQGTMGSVANTNRSWTWQIKECNRW